MKKTVIFLGAGASCSDGAPIQSELFQYFFEAITNEEIIWKYGNSEVFTEKVELVKRFLIDFFGIDLCNDLNANNPFPTFEEALGILDIAIISKEEYREKVGLLNEYRYALIFSMALAIEYGLDYKNKKPFNDNDHRKLIRFIKSLEYTEDQEKISFVSTNYDLLIDNAINAVAFDIGHKPKLLKIHGSLNQLYCPVCKKMSYYPSEKVVVSVMASRSPFNCGRCGSTQKPIIIPPTYFKEYSNNYIRNQWDEAEKVFTDAEHIVFCGYSFPDADMHIKYLLKKAEMNRDSQLPLKITVINNYYKKSASAKKAEKQRYERFFKDVSKTQFKFTTKSFSDFVNDPKKVLK